MMRWLSNISPYSIGIFAFMMVLMGIVSTMAWEQKVNDKLYHCTDALFLDFLQPGNWVHGRVEYVPQIDVNRSMSLPDEIKEGWSEEGLWYLWFAFVGVSAAISFLVASVPHAIKKVLERMRAIRAT